MYQTMTILMVKQLSKLTLTVYKGSEEVKSCYRKVVLTDKGSEEYDITLTGGDALIPLEVGQQVLVDLRCESWKHELHVVCQVLPCGRAEAYPFTQGLCQAPD
jgi:hypothetical protein